MQQLGKIAFYIGLAVSLAVGFVDIGMTGVYLLAGLGVLVGLLNVTSKEAHGFLLATLVLVTTGIAVTVILGDVIGTILKAYISFTAASGFIVALKEVYAVQKR